MATVRRTPSDPGPRPACLFTVRLSRGYYVRCQVWDVLREFWLSDAGYTGCVAGFNPAKRSDPEKYIGLLILTRTKLDLATVHHEVTHTIPYELRERSGFDEEWICQQSERLFVGVLRGLRRRGFDVTDLSW